MWSISAIKEKARERKVTNRWKMILAALVLTLVLGTNVFANLSLTWLTEDDSSNPQQEELYDEVLQSPDEMGGRENLYMSESSAFGVRMMSWLLFVTVFLLALILVLMIFIPVNVLLLNPLSVGGRRFFYRNIKEDAQVKELCYTFDYGYKNSVKVLFFRDLYLFLWTLLLIVPGLIKSYEYRLIPYLLAENPQMDQEQVFAASKRMMQGNKWKAFLMDLSFLGWRILSVLTLGILGIFYVDPYYHQADAMMYDAIKYEKEGWNTGGNQAMDWTAE